VNKITSEEQTRLKNSAKNGIIFSKHCQRRMIERGIRLRHINNVIFRPKKCVSSRESKYPHSKYELTDNEITIVAVITDDNKLLIKSVWWN